MTALATTLQAFFTDRLIRQRQASPHMLAAYRDTLRLLLVFASARQKMAPSKLDIDDLDAPLVGAFLDHLEHQRENGVRTRNARLAAIRSLFRYAALWCVIPRRCDCSRRHRPSVIALWLGHEQIETTQMYLHADLEIKERALAKTTPANTTPGRYRPPDKLLAFLQAL